MKVGRSTRLTSKVFEHIVEALEESQNNPDLIFLRPDAYREVLEDSNVNVGQFDAFGENSVARIAGMDVFVREDLTGDRPNYIMDTTHEAWPKAEDMKDVRN